MGSVARAVGGPAMGRAFRGHLGGDPPPGDPDQGLSSQQGWRGWEGWGGSCWSASPGVGEDDWEENYPEGRLEEHCSEQEELPGRGRPDRGTQRQGTDAQRPSRSAASTRRARVTAEVGTPPGREAEGKASWHQEKAGGFACFRAKCGLSHLKIGEKNHV